MAGLTSSKTGTLYFAYGSNLSSYQMHYRCLDAPEKSAIPIAVARLDRWKWVICERGYANIVPLPDDAKVEDTDEATVWGVLYNMTLGDEEVLDSYEGHNKGRNPYPQKNPDLDSAHRTPFLQDDWDYNKWYINVTITKWLQPSSVLGFNSPGPGLNEVVTVLAYVDELRTREGLINRSYIGRMNRGIEESVALGLPRSWVDKVMRRWVVPGIFPNHGYIGTNEGYVQEGGTEAVTEVVEHSSFQEGGPNAEQAKPLEA